MSTVPCIALTNLAVRSTGSEQTAPGAFELGEREKFYPNAFVNSRIPLSNGAKSLSLFYDQKQFPGRNGVWVAHAPQYLVVIYELTLYLL